MKIIFSHGKDSSPNSQKIQRLKAIAVEKGYDTLVVDYTQIFSPEERLSKLLEIISDHKEQELILVGSSMGGYISAAASRLTYVKGLFLLAPALYMPDYKVQVYKPNTQHIEVIHGWQDNVIPYEHSIRFAHEYSAKLHLVNDGHRLHKSIDFIANCFERFI